MRAKGTGSITKAGYHRLKLGRGVQKMVHVMIAEKALGKPLPSGVVVHHVNEDRLDNRNQNLVICTDAYHRLIHRRMKAFAACGNANWRNCKHCGKYEPVEALKLQGGNIYHVACQREYERKRTGVTRPIIVPEMGDKKKCPYCKQYDEPQAMFLSSYTRGSDGSIRKLYYHKQCRREHDKRRWIRQQERHGA